MLIETRRGLLGNCSEEMLEISAHTRFLSLLVARLRDFYLFYLAAALLPSCVLPANVLENDLTSLASQHST